MSSGDTNIDGLALPDSIGYEGEVGDALDENGDGDNVEDDENREMKNGMVADQLYVAAPVLSDSQDRKAMNKKVPHKRKAMTDDLDCHLAAFLYVSLLADDDCRKGCR